MSHPDPLRALEHSAELLGDLLKAAGHPGVPLYEGTKHSTATAMRKAGVPLDVIQAAAGHKSIRSTERYAQLADETVQDALKRRR